MKAATGRKLNSASSVHKQAEAWVFPTAMLWAVVLSAIFLSYRGADIGTLPQSVSSFLSTFGSLRIAPLRDSLLGALTALLVACAWFGYGGAVEQLLARLTTGSVEDEPILSWSLATRCAWGAGVTSLLMFLLGVARLYTKTIAAFALVFGLILFVRAARRLRITPFAREQLSRFSAIALTLIFFPLLLGGIAALAPPIAKDTLLYHISLPKAFLDARGLADVRYNLAQYYALGAELNGAWAMLLGRIVNLRVGEAAFGFSQFAYLPLLLLAVFGWMRKRGSTVIESLLPVALVACVPTVYSSASSGYNDCALSLYVTLAIVAAVRWWKIPDRRYTAEIGLALGFGLAIKLLALFIIVPLFVLFLLRLRVAEGTSNEELASVLRTGAIAVLLAGALAAPWYLRNWARTGSPVYPFYMNIFHGKAPGWDQQRSLTDQILNSRYGGYPKSAFEYAAVPVRVSLSAQPDIPRDFDGVLGISFLFGLPLLLLALRGRRLDIEIKIAAALPGAYFVFWLFSSEQLRYLLPVLPALAVAICASSLVMHGHIRYVVLATAVPGLLVIAALFAQQNPVAVVLGAEPRNAYLERMLDHYSIYETLNSALPHEARVWLINMRRDTYYIERPYFSDFRIEHYTLAEMVRDSNTAEELRRRVHEMGITHILLRTDLLLDYAISPLVDDSKPRADNEQKLQMFRQLLTEGRVIKMQGHFMLVDVR